MNTQHAVEHQPAEARMPRMVPALERVPVLGVPIVRSTAEEVLANLDWYLDDSRVRTVFYANAHTLNVASEQPALRAALNEAALVLNDGAGVAIAGRLRGTPFPENLNGTDFTPRILRAAAEHGLGVYLLGGRPGVAEAAALMLSSTIPGLRVVGCRDGYFDDEESTAVAERIRASGAAVVLAAMGNPRQELWLAEHLAATGARLGVAVGAFLDFAAGEVSRAPRWMNTWGVEWVWRMAQEPRRLWRRYVVGNPKFLSRAMREAWELRGRPPVGNAR
jgi:exopolysaccharide biosynthesis WecB/TagA/CpsF family protein